MKVSIDNTTGLLIESQSSSADDKALIANAAAAGYTNVSVKVVTQTEHSALIAARDLARKSPAEHAEDKSAVLTQARAIRETVLNRLTGIQLNTLSTDTATLSAIQTARASLLNITSIVGVVAATDGPTTKSAIIAEWNRIAAILTTSAPSAANAFNGAQI